MKNLMAIFMIIMMIVFGSGEVNAGDIGIHCDPPLQTGLHPQIQTVLTSPYHSTNTELVELFDKNEDTGLQGFRFRVGGIYDRDTVTPTPICNHDICQNGVYRIRLDYDSKMRDICAIGTGPNVKIKACRTAYPNENSVGYNRAIRGKLIKNIRGDDKFGQGHLFCFSGTNALETFTSIHDREPERVETLSCCSTRINYRTGEPYLFRENECEIGDSLGALCYFKIVTPDAPKNLSIERGENQTVIDWDAPVNEVWVATIPDLLTIDQIVDKYVITIDSDYLDNPVEYTVSRSFTELVIQNYVINETETYTISVVAVVVDDVYEEHVTHKSPPAKIVDYSPIEEEEIYISPPPPPMCPLGYTGTYPDCEEPEPPCEILGDDENAPWPTQEECDMRNDDNEDGLDDDTGLPVIDRPSPPRPEVPVVEESEEEEVEEPMTPEMKEELRATGGGCSLGNSQTRSTNSPLFLGAMIIVLIFMVLQSTKEES